MDSVRHAHQLLVAFTLRQLSLGPQAAAKQSFTALSMSESVFDEDLEALPEQACRNQSHVVARA